MRERELDSSIADALEMTRTVLSSPGRRDGGGGRWIGEEAQQPPPVVSERRLVHTARSMRTS
jgi:hypothetical protein